MQSGKRRTATRNGVVAGSVWESRMKLDEVKGGIKVFNGGESPEEGVNKRRLKRYQSDGPVEKRKTWKSEMEKNPIQLSKTRSDSQRKSHENFKESGVCKEKTIPGCLSNVSEVGSRKVLVVDDVDDGQEVEEEEEEEEREKKTFDVKEMNLAEEQPRKVAEEEKKLHQIEEIPIPDPVDKNPTPSPVISQKKLHQIEEIPVCSPVDKNPTASPVISQNKLHEIHEMPISPTLDKKPLQPPVIPHPVIDPNINKPPTIPFEESYESFPETQNRLQSIVDLVMWRDISKSALVFGFGTFILLSSSYTKDLNFSFISAVSYLGLVYLAAIFFYKSILCRGAIDFDDSSQKYVLGEDEAVWLLKMVLPYFNELLLKIRSLFSGDPPTTMKMGILLFVLARRGNSITIWTMAKLAFFGVFIVPKICSAYSTQLTGYAKFWVRRFEDAWNSCTQKKAVAAAIFTVIWNLSSVIARIWAVFILIVAVKFYQQSLIREEWCEEEVAEESSREAHEHRRKGGLTLTESTKEKKGS